MVTKSDPEIKETDQTARSVQENTTEKKKQSNLGVNIMITICSLVLLIGIGVLCYPSVADWWNRLVSSRAVGSYSQVVKEIPKVDKEKMLAEAKQYNEDLLTVPDRFHPSEEMDARYKKTLDVTGTGIMGYVSIPKLKQQMPIYHGTAETVLQIATGHIEGTSLPVGGPSTHVAISGHTGLPSAKLFTGLDTMQKGDQFSVTVLDKQLWYQVDQIKVVLPGELQDLAIEQGKDYMTLITCTPYGVNSHRLLVRGHAIPAPTNDPTHYEDTRDLMNQAIALAALVFLVLALITFWLIRRRAKKRAAAALAAKATEELQK
ncbi:sortase [Bifidobacterium dolichotidis]|uniref:Sortase n=1 Tax=Bifidobacterium dolichotidis TaxID=2306976 RepID=A0A430FQF5_9BIFI|nr:class C sortase [Bifidobacterium dolichotidis]RSX55061.1 sortase [Bifidobacterium dolichotidis]